MSMCFKTVVLRLGSLLVIGKIVLTEVVADSEHVSRETHMENTPAFIRDSLNIHALVSTSVKNELCRKHSLWFQEGVLKNKLWALKMLDASSKLPNGIFSGNGAHLGDYDGCLSVEDVASEFGRFSGQHCMVALGEHSFANEINFLTRKDMLMQEEIPSDNNMTLEDWVPRLSLLWSVCVPSSCEPRDVENHLRTVLSPVLGSNINVTVAEGACNSNAFEITLHPRDWLVIALLSVILVLAVVSTLYDIKSWNSSTRNELYLAFSLKLHRRKMLKVYPKTIDDLPVLCGVRVISMCWIIIIHFQMITFLYPAVNHHIIYQTMTCAICRFLSNGTAVDTFLLLSGLLVCYNYLKDREEGLTFSLFRYYFHRYVRLTPMFFMMQLLTLTLYTIPGLFGGPMWRNSAADFRRNCENWFHNMLYISNYQHKENMCIGHTWYLSVDMQLFLLSPLILYPLWRWPAFGKFLLGILSLLGSFISMLVAYIANLTNKTVADQGELGELHYYPTHTRFTPWLIGIAVGYLLHHTKHQTPRLSRRLVKGAWTLSVLMMLGSLPIIYFMLRHDYRSDRFLSAFYVGLLRPCWALGVAWLVFALSRGYGPRSMTSFLSQPYFQVLSRLCYSIYLTHIAVILFQLAHMRTPVYFHTTTFGPNLLANMIISIVVGAIFYLFIEAPPIYIEKVLLKQKQRIKGD